MFINEKISLPVSLTVEIILIRKAPVTILCSLLTLFHTTDFIRDSFVRFKTILSNN